MSDVIITADKIPWYQWDTGRTVTVAGGTMTECHFANRKQGTAYVQAVIKGTAKVPDELLQVAAPIKVYGYISDGGGGQTYVEQTFKVIARNIPADYTYTKTAQKTIRDAETARDQAYAAADNVLEVANQVVGFKNDAKASADAAKKSADHAEYQAGRAKTNADDAGVAMANAQSFAKMSSVHATESKGIAEKSAQSASAAATSASEAATSASEAATSASEAKAAAGNAADSAVAAAKSAGDAAASVNAINVIAPKTIADGATAPSLSFSAGYGASCTENANYSVAIGNMAEVSEIGSIAIGSDTISSVTGAVALGYNAKVNHTNSAAIASHSETTKENEFSIGSTYYAGGEYTREITHVSTPTNDTSASTKKYTDDNDAKTLNEAKKYTDDNTTNALVGKVSGKLLHVEDAWPDKPLSLTIDGAYKQDGTPSFESPAPITVIEHPVLHVMGRNLTNVPDMTVQSNDVNISLFDCGLIPNGTTAYLSVVSSANAAPKFDNAASSGLSDGTQFVYSILPANVTEGVNKTTITPTFDATKHLRFYGYRQPTTSFEISNYQLEVGGYHDYRPYTSAILPITLPDEHPYLAALPDGTADEIVIDANGNVKLIARVGMDENIRTINYVKVGEYYNLASSLPSFKKYEDMKTSYALCTALPMLNMSTGVQIGIYRTWNGIYVKYDTQETKNELQALLDTVAPITVIGNIPDIVYDLGKVDVPRLPEEISNVYISGELVSKCSMTYRKDINIVVANLTAQIAALKGTADTSPDEDSAASPDDVTLTME